MSTINIYTCDRCKKQTQNFIGWMTVSVTGVCVRTAWDLCEECKEKLLCFVRKKPYKD